MLSVLLLGFAFAFAGPQEEQFFDAAKQAFDASAIAGIGTSIPEEGVFIQGSNGRCFSWDGETGYAVKAADDLNAQRIVFEDPVLHLQALYWTLNGLRVTDMASGEFGHSYVRQLGPAFFITNQLVLRKAAMGSGATWWTRYSQWLDRPHELSQRRYCYYL